MSASEGFFPAFFYSFFIALGVLIGGVLLGGLAAYLLGDPPLTEMGRLVSKLRIWAIIAAIGGTFDTLYSFERGFLQGETIDLFKQFLLILSAMGGAQVANQLFTWWLQEHIS
ncbi:YtrH family sporulation protein [Mangrovibacillus cuniculi]|uniref:Sporulation protein n=1 Tax=Mangrovibacillus cuniculi TaxID=2593652 RepID=A0A7S8CC17_9BACI|nr:YtrH family sporulation protein [Mangrovibacillus cuniculi]QPC47214.1 sporulation protein [Mangrovibacillus cuniculi]